MKNLYILLIFIALGFLSCNQSYKRRSNDRTSNEALPIEKANWLIGDWQNESDNGILSETWYKLDDSTLVGKSYFVAGSDTFSSEIIRLEQRKGKLSYIPTVQGQNNGQAVYFTLTISTDSLLGFENPEHDFPQKITYANIGNDSLVAEISAIVDGKLKSKTFRMGKSPKYSTVRIN